MQCASLTLALLGIQVICGASVLHHITPSPSLECTTGVRTESCLTLSTFAANVNNYTDSNDTTLIFLAGNHILDSTLSISDITFLRLLTNCSEISTIVSCSDGAHMKFVGVAQIEIQNLNFIGCSSLVQSVEQFILADSSFHGASGYSSALNLNQIYAANVINSSFTFNSHDSMVATYRESVDSSFSNRGGGALAIGESNLEIYRSQFIGNTAQLGGAMLIERNSNIIIIDSLFANNSAEFCYGASNCYGGAMYIDSGCIVRAQNTIFLNNTSEFCGGAIAIFQATYVDIQNVFYYNQAYYREGDEYELSSSIASHYSANEVSGNGAAIFAQNNAQITTLNSNFSKNRAENSGGVISAFFNSTIMAYNGHFENNTAAFVAGVVHAIRRCYITLNKCSFNGNRAHFGGVMYIEENSKVTVESSSFDSNFALQDVGVLAAMGSNVTVDKSFFINNTAGIDMGVLYATLFDVTISNSFFQNNKAGSAGGVMYMYFIGRLVITNSSFLNNEAGFEGGVAVAFDFCHIIFENCMFFNNTAFEGGVLFVRNALFEDFSSIYINNRANIDGGVIAMRKGNVTVRSSKFTNNTARFNGGVLHTPIHRYVHTILLEENTFDGNRAKSGGVIALFNQDWLELIQNKFSHNEAHDGGVIYLYSENTVIIKDGDFSDNLASGDGGVIHLVQQNSLTISNSKLNFNSAGNSGGVLYSLLQNDITVIGNSCSFTGNQAHSGGVIYANDNKVNLQCQALLMESNTAMDAGGAMHLSNTNVTFFNAGDNIIARNRAKTGGALFVIESSLRVQSNSLLIVNNTAMGNGGGMWLSECQLVISNGINKLIGNEAENGGGVYSSQSRLLTKTNSFTQINSNTANLDGGGLYLMSSTLEIGQDTLYIMENRAHEAGGGLHAANSSVMIEGVLHCANNHAKNGGGFSLERYTRLYGKSAENDSIDFVSNTASDLGGALYINDETNPDMCVVDSLQNATSKTEYCFLNSLFFTTLDNSAGVSGSNLFGGLLDRCKVEPVFHKTATSGLAIFQQLSDVSSDTISSHPVRMCFCQDSRPDCDYQPQSIQVQRQTAFSVQLIAYDQVNHTINATVDSSLNSSAGGLGEGQGTQQIGEECTTLEFTLFSPMDSEELMLTLQGPCNVTGVSKRSVIIEVTCKCPIGFQVSNSADKTACVCTCDQILQPYTRTECNATTQSIIRRDEFWIAYINQASSSGYLIYPYCPFDYCHSPGEQVSVNLNIPHGSNAQCVAHRSGTLCGSCEPGYSVSLGSSHCLQCPSYWPVLVATITVVFVLSGVALVIFLLILNLTVAIGTLNAVIFYANIIAASKSALFPSGASFASVFISFLNFDLGFDMCFFDGMDTYVKTWLQLAFPAYIILLVALIIKLSYHYTFFGRLIGKKDPVATLATLILLSYTKLLQTIITSFSSASLTYPDGSRKTVWLPDATIGYFTTKHALLFCTAILILLLGFVYTFLLFLWQWLLRLPRKYFKWIQNPKFCTFLKVYFIPYAPKHRYWTGLLLLVRVILYLVSAFNPSGDPRLILLSTTFVVSFLFLYIAVYGVWMYKNWYINAMETFTYFNIIAVSIITLYSLGSTNINQTAVTNVSVAIAFTQLMAVISFHALKFTILTKVQKSKICHKMWMKFRAIKQKKRSQFGRHEPLPEINFNDREILDIIDGPVNTNDYNIPQIHPVPAEPTQSVIELPIPRLAPQTSKETVTEVQEQEVGPHQLLKEPDYCNSNRVSTETINLGVKSSTT